MCKYRDGHLQQDLLGAWRPQYMCLWSSIATYCLVFAVIQVLFPYLSCFHFIMLCDGIICTLLLQRRFFGFVSVDVRNFIQLKPGTHKIGGG